MSSLENEEDFFEGEPVPTEKTIEAERIAQLAEDDDEDVYDNPAGSVSLVHANGFIVACADSLIAVQMFSGPLMLRSFTATQLISDSYRRSCHVGAYFNLKLSSPKSLSPREYSAVLRV